MSITINQWLQDSFEKSLRKALALKHSVEPDQIFWYHSIEDDEDDNPVDTWDDGLSYYVERRSTNNYRDLSHYTITLGAALKLIMERNT